MSRARRPTPRGLSPSSILSGCRAKGWRVGLTRGISRCYGVIYINRIQKGQNEMQQNQGQGG